ncbi:hypothetical protein OG372_14435 [Streptomyces sp. NBC_01020]|uniref:DUF2231 domain-containing protein n=1 Tax=Streptomyces sp. NBC_01020 TaxID=2903722 RepID=UPI003863B4A6|nr:hypothetical protein OG372_14435 [Streptomyces sp. NBC_01020]
MGPTVINGLPAHVLLVHFVVVLVPLTALALVVASVWPAWIRKLGLALPILALVTLISVPITTHAGEWLEKHTDSDPLVRKHADLGDGLLPWAIGLFAVAVAVWWFGRRATIQSSDTEDSRRSGAVALSVPVRVAAIALSVIVAAGSVVQVYRIGDSGAKAAWHDGYSAKPISGKDH